MGDQVGVGGGQGIPKVGETSLIVLVTLLPTDILVAYGIRIIRPGRQGKRLHEAGGPEPVYAHPRPLTRRFGIHNSVAPRWGGWYNGRS